MKTTVFSIFAVLSLFAVSPVHADVGEAQKTICSESHYDASNKAARPCGTVNQQVAYYIDENQKAYGHG